MVFADVVGEEIDAGAAVGRGGCGWGGGGQGVEVRAAEHVAFADDAGGDGSGVDAGVEFRVGGRLEHFFQAAACNRVYALGEIRGKRAVGNCACCGGNTGSRGGWDVDHKGQLVHEFVFAPTAARLQAAEAVDHAPRDAAADPDVAVDDPDDVAFGVAVAAAHVADLGVGPEVVYPAIASGEVGVLFFHQYFGIVIGEVRK